MIKLRGWRYVAFVSSIVGFIGLALYPIIIDPMMNVEKYKKIREIARPSPIVQKEPVQSGSS